MTDTKAIDRGRSRRAALVLLAGLLVAAPAWAGDERSDEASRAEQDAEVYTNRDLSQSGERRSRVYTNEDLERMFQPVAGTEPAEEARPPQERRGRERPPEARQRPAPDPLEQLRAEQKAAEVRRQRVQQAKAELEAARARLESLQVQLLATVNPFSRRPQLSEEEKALRASSGESAAERRDRTQLLVEQARADVAKLEAQLAELQRQP